MQNEIHVQEVEKEKALGGNREQEEMKNPM